MKPAISPPISARFGNDGTVIAAGQMHRQAVAADHLQAAPTPNPTPARLPCYGPVPISEKHQW